VFVCEPIASHLRDIKATTVSFEPSSAKAVLLANDTELSVAPKTRHHQNSEKKQLVKSETSVTSPNTATKPLSQKPSHSVLLRVLPSSAFSYHLPSPPDLVSVGYVSKTMLSVYRLDGLLPPDPKMSLVADVKRLSPPTDPTDSNPPSPDIPAVAKVLNPSEANKRDVTEIPNEDGKVKLVGLDGVPEGQIIIVGGVDSVEDWDVVRYVSSMETNRGSWNSPASVQRNHLS
jgi:peroxin-1